MSLTSQPCRIPKKILRSPSSSIYMNIIWRVSAGMVFPKSCQTGISEMYKDSHIPDGGRYLYLHGVLIGPSKRIWSVPQICWLSKGIWRFYTADTRAVKWIWFVTCWVNKIPNWSEATCDDQEKPILSWKRHQVMGYPGTCPYIIGFYFLCDRSCSHGTW